MRFSFAMFACGVIASFAQSPGVTQFTAISYNVQFLPALAETQNKRPDPEYRAKRIAGEVARFDMVALQETFEETHRNTIKEGVKAAWNGRFGCVESPKPKNFLINGGCLFMTRLPILASDAVIYTHFSAPEDFGFHADGFAAKGVIWTRVARSESAKDDYIDVFVTHLEARAPDMRPFQYQEMADFIAAKSSPQHPAILLGDLNTNGLPGERQNTSSQYSTLARALAGARGALGFADTWVALMGDKKGCTTEQDSTETGKRIDYIWYSNPLPPAPRIAPSSIAINGYLDSRVTALSDHSAVIAEFSWPTPNEATSAINR